MTMRAMVLLAVLAATGPGTSPACGQVGGAVRVGTLGVGAEAAVDLSGRIALRGGAGLAMGLSTFRPSTTFDGVDVDLVLPNEWYNVGLDYYLNGVIRIGGGVVFVSDEPTLRGAFAEPVDIGGTTLTPSEIGLLTGVVSTNRRAAYALVGLGRHTTSGFGVSLDVGAAFLGNDPSVTLAATGGSYAQEALADLLVAEARSFENDMKTYLTIWPLLSFGLRYGIG